MILRNYFIFCVLLFIPLFAPLTLLAGTVTTDLSDIIVNVKGPIQIKTTDGSYSAKLGGRLMWDYNYAELNGEADEDDFSIRRARLYLSGKVNDWSYKLQFNVGNSNGGTPEDLYIRYNGWGKQAVLTVGKQKVPFGLEWLESANSIRYLERSAIIEAYSPLRQEGILFSGQSGNITYAVGVFEDDIAGDGAAVASRVTYNPIKSSEQLLHLALAHSSRATEVEATGVELAYVQGPYHFQSEFMSSDNKGVSSDGFYMQAGWIITGETRPYKSGVFRKIKPGSASGAWEVVVRYEDGEGNYSDQELGMTDATSYGFGVNYYANEFIRIGATYTDAQDNLNNNDGSEFRVRLQLAL
jgi:phosphate-selective porin OprO/OprP